MSRLTDLNSLEDHLSQRILVVRPEWPFFLGSDTIVFETNVQAVGETMLEPGASRLLTNTVLGIPANWVKGKVRASVTDISF